MWSAIFATGTMKWMPVCWIGSSSGKISSKLFDYMWRFKCTTRLAWLHRNILAGCILIRFRYLSFRLTKQFSNAIGTVVSALLCATALWMCSGLLYILVVSMSPSKANFLKSEKRFDSNEFTTNSRTFPWRPVGSIWPPVCNDRHFAPPLRVHFLLLRRSDRSTIRFVQFGHQSKQLVQIPHGDAKAFAGASADRAKIDSIARIPEFAVQ